jgi:hypothetical protein
VNQQIQKFISPKFQCFFTGEFLQKFNLKNAILTNPKHFSWGKNGPNSPNSEKNIKFKLPDFYNKFQ